MNDFITEYCFIITQYGCLIIYSFALSLGFLNIIRFLYEKIYKTLKAMIAASKGD